MQREEAEEAYYRPIRCTILDTKTGRTAEETRASLYDLEYGNWSCDCNRGSAFEFTPEEWPEVEICVGAHRFLIVSADIPPFCDTTIDELNGDYPTALVAKFLHPRA